MVKKRKPRKYYAKTKASKGTSARRGVLVFTGVLLSVIVLFGAYLLLSFAGSVFFSHNSYFELKHVMMSSDGRLTPSKLMEYGGVERGSNLFAVDLKTLRKDLEAVALIESVQVQRRLPDTLVVRVAERVAVAQVSWKWRAPCFLIDHEGIVLPPTRAGRALPMIEGLKLEQLRPGEQLDDFGVQYVLELLTILRLTPAYSIVEFERFNLKYPDYINSTLVNGVSARFPRHSAKMKLIRLVDTLQQAKVSGNTITTVDLVPDGINTPTY
jgi:cell division protein FtsQ